MRDKSRTLRSTIEFLRILVLAVVLGGALSCGAEAWARDSQDQASRRDHRLAYFPDSYAEARLNFRHIAHMLARRYDHVEIDRLTVPSSTDRDLTIDYVFIPAQETPENLFISTSGTHGIEGFMGSAVQAMLMKEVLPTLDLSHTGVLIIHAVNPWGFKHEKRVNQYNVDMNRNFSADPALYQTPNPAFALLDYFIDPQKKVNLLDPENANYQFYMGSLVAQYGLDTLMAAIVLGQYDYPKGLFYGGEAAQAQVDLIQSLLVDKIDQYHKVFHMDLHTGYGLPDQPLLWGTPVTDPASQAAIATVFAGYPVNTPYVPHGDMVVFSMGLTPAGKVFVPITIEYGTVDYADMLGQMDSLQRMKLENQGSFWGYRARHDEVTVKHNFKEMFYPSDPTWRSKVMATSAAWLSDILLRFSAL